MCEINKICTSFSENIDTLQGKPTLGLFVNFPRRLFQACLW